MIQNVLQSVRDLLSDPACHCIGDYAQDINGRYAPYWRVTPQKTTDGRTKPAAIKWSITGAVLLHCEINNLDPRPVVEALGPYCERRNDLSHASALAHLDRVIERTKS